MVSDREVKFAPETEGSPRLVIAKDLSDELRARIHRAARLAYRALKLRDYARMDFRIAKTGEPYMLEANPNPYLEKTGELAMAAADAGLDYAQLVSRILESAAVRYHLHVREAPRQAGPRRAVLGRSQGAGRSGLSHTSFRCLIEPASVLASRVLGAGQIAALFGSPTRDLPALEVEEDQAAVGTPARPRSSSGPASRR